jgi:hypothetical protein
MRSSVDTWAVYRGHVNATHVTGLSPRIPSVGDLSVFATCNISLKRTALSERRRSSHDSLGVWHLSSSWNGASDALAGEHLQRSFRPLTAPPPPSLLHPSPPAHCTVAPYSPYSDNQSNPSSTFVLREVFARQCRRRAPLPPAFSCLVSVPRMCNITAILRNPARQQWPA